MGSKDTFFSRKLTINCGGILLDLASPKVMGILNHTPDSFYDGNRYMKEAEIRERFEELITEGADMVDVGCYSSRPGAVDVSPEDEKARFSEVMKAIKGVSHHAILSVDTFRSGIAEFAVREHGVSMINDISAGRFDDRMLEVVGRLKVPYIMMHMKGTPRTMQIDPVYDDLMKEVISFFAERIRAARESGVNDIIVDPGFGFGKTVEHNFILLRNLRVFSMLELPVMAGISRKSMICRTLDCTPAEALNGTTVLNAMALMNGANIFRVHDVREAREAVRLYEAYQAASS
ncbi:MAG: dihydropteroate synthase [Bacteroidales bacterium]|nr:dihydropteroate synthase [Bacteroidales bacterium]